MVFVLLSKIWYFIEWEGLSYCFYYFYWSVHVYFFLITTFIYISLSLPVHFEYSIRRFHSTTPFNSSFILLLILCIDWEVLDYCIHSYFYQHLSWSSQTCTAMWWYYLYFNNLVSGDVLQTIFHLIYQEEEFLFIVMTTFLYWFGLLLKIPFEDSFRFKFSF